MGGSRIGREKGDKQKGVLERGRVRERGGRGEGEIQSYESNKTYLNIFKTHSLEHLPLPTLWDSFNMPLHCTVH